MKKITEWESEIDGKYYKISHQKIKSKHVITVNESSVEIKDSFMNTIIGFDEKFTLDGMEARLVIENNKPDVVVNGVFLQSGKKYIQRPAWSLIFAVICMLIPIVSLGGALPFLLGGAGATLCVNVSKTSWSLAARVISCILFTLVAWLLWFYLMVGFSMLF
jgi:hypothetical protein